MSTVGLSIVTSLNIKLLDFLKEILSIKYTERGFSVPRDVSDEDLLAVVKFAENNIWSRENVRSAVTAVSDDRHETRYIIGGQASQRSSTAS